MPTTPTTKQQLAESRYLPERSLRDDVLDARRQGHSWRAIAQKVNDLLAKNPLVTVAVTHESLRQWYGELDPQNSPAGRAAG
jgi:hypothetical protein